MTNADITTKVITYKYRLNPSKIQHKRMSDALKETQQLYNAGLQERIDAYRKFGLSIGLYEQYKSLTEYRRDEAIFSATMQRWPLKKLDLAFKAFFKRVKSGEKAGFPRYKSLNNCKSFGFSDGGGWTVKDNVLKMKGIGKVRIKMHRELPNKPLSCVVRKQGARWFACLSVEVPVKEVHNGPTIGLDAGVINMATLSNGEYIINPRFNTKYSKKVRIAQRSLARCKRNSNRRKKVKARLVRLHERAANARSTYLHQVSADLTKTFSTIIIEDLKLKNMVKSAKGATDKHGKNVKQKSGLNRSLHDVAIGKFFEYLTYKAEKAGGQVIRINPMYTSQTCSNCGAVNKDSRVSQSVFDCINCNHKQNADHNAAINIAAKGGVVVPEEHNVASYRRRVLGNISLEFSN